MGPRLGTDPEQCPLAHNSHLTPAGFPVARPCSCRHLNIQKPTMTMLPRNGSRGGSRIETKREKETEKKTETETATETRSNVSGAVSGALPELAKCSYLHAICSQGAARWALAGATA